MNKVYISQEQAELIHGEEEALAHFGVKGMKWGVRKDQNSEKSLNRAAKKTIKLANKNYLKIYNAMADESAAFYAKINENPKYKNLNLYDEANRNSKLAKSYLNETAKAATESLQRNSDRILGNKVDSRLKVTWHLPEEMGSMPTFYVERAEGDIKHADISDDKIKLILTFNDNGKIVRLDFPKELFS